MINLIENIAKTHIPYPEGVTSHPQHLVSYLVLLHSGVA
jgi:hypothetical protein